MTAYHRSAGMQTTSQVVLMLRRIFAFFRIFYLSDAFSLRKALLVESSEAGKVQETHKDDIVTSLCGLYLFFIYLGGAYLYLLRNI
jgi:hypothetical protein